MDPVPQAKALQDGGHQRQLPQGVPGGIIPGQLSGLVNSLPQRGVDGHKLGDGLGILYGNQPPVGQSLDTGGILLGNKLQHLLPYLT